MHTHRHATAEIRAVLRETERKTEGVALHRVRLADGSGEPRILRDRLLHRRAREDRATREVAGGSVDTPAVALQLHADRNAPVHAAAAIRERRAEDLDERRHREPRATPRRLLQLDLCAEEHVAEAADDRRTRLARVVV